MRYDTGLPATHTFIKKWIEPYLPLLPAAHPHHPFPVLPTALRIRGGVGPDVSVKGNLHITASTALRQTKLVY